MGGMNSLLSRARASIQDWWLLSEKELLTRGGELFNQAPATHANVLLVLSNKHFGRNEVLQFLGQCIEDLVVDGVVLALVDEALKAALSDWSVEHMGRATKGASAKKEAAKVIESARTSVAAAFYQAAVEAAEAANGED